MPNPSARTFGFELEYASGGRALVRELFSQGVTLTDELHRYHCDCDHCRITAREIYDRNDRLTLQPAPDLHAQTDSTADGEFITRILNDWGDLARIAETLTHCATAVDARTGPRCGLHVHVGAEGSDRMVPLAYLAYERYFTEIIAPGRSQQKRDMNTTLMQAFRQYVVDGYLGHTAEFWRDLSRLTLHDHLIQTIGRDRHVDLNRNTRHDTWEFRVFNATNSPWRIELAARMSVAFVQATPALAALIEESVKGSGSWPVGCDSPWGEIARPAWSNLPAPHPTKRPVVTMDAFIECLSDVDPALRPLIERQRSYMRARYAKMVS